MESMMEDWDAIPEAQAGIDLLHQRLFVAFANKARVDLDKPRAVVGKVRMPPPKSSAGSATQLGGDRKGEAPDQNATLIASALVPSSSPSPPPSPSPPRSSCPCPSSSSSSSSPPSLIEPPPSRRHESLVAATTEILVQAKASLDAVASLIQSLKVLLDAGVLDAARERAGWPADSSAPSHPVGLPLPAPPLPIGVGPYEDRDAFAWECAPASPCTPPNEEDGKGKGAEEAQTSQLRIVKWDGRLGGPGQVNFIVGKRGSGKSTLCADLLAKYAAEREYAAVVLMSPTPEDVELFRGIVPDSCIYEEFNPEAIDRMIETLRVVNGCGSHPRTAIVLSDCLFDPKVLKSRTMRDLFMNSRHLGVDVFVVMQCVMDIPRVLRSQIDRVFAMQEPNMQYRKSLYDNFFGIVGDFDTFNAIMDGCTEYRRCVVMDHTVRSHRVNECVFWYKVRPRGVEPCDPWQPCDPCGNPIAGDRSLWVLHHMFHVPPPPAFDMNAPAIPSLAVPPRKGGARRAYRCPGYDDATQE